MSIPLARRGQHQLSGDGQHVAVAAISDQLAPGDTNSVIDIFRFSLAP